MKTSYILTVIWLKCLISLAISNNSIDCACNNPVTSELYCNPDGCFCLQLVHYFHNFSLTRTKLFTVLSKLLTFIIYTVITNIVLQVITFRLAMKGRNKSRCRPPSYNWSGCRFDVDTKICDQQESASKNADTCRSSYKTTTLTFSTIVSSVSNDIKWTNMRDYRATEHGGHCNYTRPVSCISTQIGIEKLTVPLLKRWSNSRFKIRASATSVTCPCPANPLNSVMQSIKI